MFRYPLELQSGAQCRVLEGFGKTICSKLDRKLSEYRARQHLALSPVLKPSGQIPQSSKESTSKKFSRNSPIESHSRRKNSLPEEEELELAISLSQQEADRNRSEEEDLKLAIRLSQSNTEEDNVQYNLDDEQNPSKSQEDLDREFALELQERFNQETDQQPTVVRKSPQRKFFHRGVDDQQTSVVQSPPARLFTFDRQEDLSNIDNTRYQYEDDGLPDISFVPDEVEPPNNKVVVNLVSKSRKKPVHDISEVSDEEGGRIEGVDLNDKSKVSDVEEGGRIEGVDLDALLAADPVMNRRRSQSIFKEKKSKKSSEKKSKKSKNSTPEKTPKKQKATKSPRSSQKEYVPRKGSGAYAVLVTLYEESSRPSYRGYLNKKRLIEAAQPIANQSFEMANNKTEHYTAWSGVAHLVRHELVIKWSNPAKYNITEKGKRLAAKIINSEGEDGGGDIGQSGGSKRKRGISEESQDSLQEEVRRKRLEKFDSGRTQTSRPLFDEEDDDEQLKKALELSRLEAEKSKPLTSQSDPMLIDIPNFDLEDSFNLSDLDPKTDENTVQVSHESRKESKQQKDDGGGRGQVPLRLQLHQNVQAMAAASAPVGNSHRAEFVLTAGSYEVILCVDNTETQGGGVGGRKTLREETARHLQSCGVPYDRRNLNLGDFLWVAREKPEISGQRRPPRELVLPYIIERKRLDDLWQSVKDGRYEEQKFRMKRCGVSHLYYLVEDYKTKREFWGRAGPAGVFVTADSIEQAVANTAVQGGFTIKRTADQKETIEYLTLMTRLLTRKYSGLTLTSCSQTDIDDGLVGERDTTLLTFTDFNDSTKKNKNKSIGEVWALMLLRMKGLSVEMAMAITNLYPTPASLVLAYRNCNTVQEKIKLLSDQTYGMENKRKIPKSVSEALVKVWSFPNF